MQRAGTAWKDRTRSSWTIQLALGCCNLARPLLAALGVDVGQLRAILALRLSLDLNPRLSPGAGETSLGLILTCCATWLAGLGPGVIAIVAEKPELWMGIGQAMTLALCLLFMFAHYGQMLVDSTDVRVISPLPVSGRTLFAARVAHALYYTSILCACASFFPAVLGALAFPPWWALTIYPLATFLSGFTALTLISIAYALLLRFAGPGRFQRLSVWVQIAGTSAVMAALQIGPRLFARNVSDATLDAFAWLRWFAPPMHQLGLYELAASGWTRERAAMTALAFVVPIAGLALALALASRHFVAALSARETHSSRSTNAWRVGFFSRLGARLTRTRDERAGYDFALALARRERTFLRVTVPQVVMFGAMGFGSLRAHPHMGALFGRFFEHVPITFTALFGPMVVASTMSENFDARWLVRAAPVADPAKFGVAALRALFAGFVMPAMLVIMGVITATNPLRAPSLVLAFELALVTSLVAVRHLQVPFPFCQKPRTQTGNMRDLPVVLTTVFVSFPAAALAAAASYHWAIATAAALAVLPLCVVAWRRLDRVRFLELGW